MALVSTKPQKYGAVAINGTSVVASPTAIDSRASLRVEEGTDPFAVAVYQRQDLQPIGDAAAALVTAHSPYVAWLPTALTDMLLAQDQTAGTYWVPGPGDAQTPSLLQALHVRGASAKTFILVHSRPDSELRRNFSLCNGLCVDISAPRFKLSRTSIALQNINNMPDHVQMTSGHVKREMVKALPALKVDEFFLLRYRDYSDWALRQYASEARRDVVLGPMYVERFFALRVGNNPGVLIPITERQLLAGYEILQRRELEQSHMPTTTNPKGAADEPAVNRHAITEDQFRSLGGRVEEMLEDTSAAALQEQLAQAQAQAQQSQHRGGYVPPAWYDWRPSAIQIRLAHALEEQYKSVGRFVVKTVLVGMFLYLGVQLVRRGLGVDDARRLPTPPPSSARGRRRSSGGYAVDSDSSSSSSSGGVVGAVVKSFFSVGPKQLLDFALAPSAVPTQR
jgi:hypothetical protein